MHLLVMACCSHFRHLSAKLNDRSRMEGALTEWRIIFETYNSAEAQVIVGRLDASGIPALVYQEAGGRALGITVGRLGEVKVLVRPADFERAVAILEPDDSAELPDSTDAIIYHFDDEGEDESDSD